MSRYINARIETEAEVKAYIQNLRFALNSGARIDFQVHRRVDENREERFTNQYTISTLFPSENPLEALRRELLHFAEKAFTPDMFPYRK